MSEQNDDDLTRSVRTAVHPSDVHAAEDGDLS